MPGAVKKKVTMWVACFERARRRGRERWACEARAQTRNLVEAQLP